MAPIDIDKVLDGIPDRLRYLHAVWDAGEIVKKMDFHPELKKTNVTQDDFAYILVATMCYLLDQELHERNRETSQDEIEEFLLLLPKELGITQTNVKTLASYVVNSSLMNEGRLRIHQVFDPKLGLHVKMPTKLAIKGFKGVRLDEQGYDLLFRSREYALYFDFNIHDTILRTAVENHDYNQAKRESEELLSTANSAWARVINFQARCRADIMSVEDGEYERYRKLASDAQASIPQLSELETILEAGIVDLAAGVEAIDVETIRKQNHDIRFTKTNIMSAVAVLEELGVVVERFRDEYQDLQSKSMLSRTTRGLDVQQTFIMPAIKLSAGGIESLFDRMCCRLRVASMNPLATPSNIYGLTLPDINESEPEEEEFEEDVVFIEEEDEKTFARRKIIEVARIFLPWLKTTRGGFTSEFIATLDEDALAAITEGKAFPNLLHDIYREREVDLPTTYDENVTPENKVIEEDAFTTLFSATGVTFEPGEVIVVSLTDDMTSWSCLENGEWIGVSMTDFKIEVIAR